MEKNPIRTGIFGGTFDPIHLGHLALANYLCEENWVDELWFLITPQNPFIQEQTLLDNHLRMKMVEAAIADYPRFKASDFEFTLPRPSYTVTTLQKLSETYPDREFVLIIGADNWAAFDKWKSPEEILRNHRILVYPRPGYEINPHELPAQVKAVNTPLLEISSTFIRESIASGKDIRYFLHPEVYRFIKQHQLYNK